MTNRRDVGILLLQIFPTLNIRDLQYLQHFFLFDVAHKPYALIWRSDFYEIT